MSQTPYFLKSDSWPITKLTRLCKALPNDLPAVSDPVLYATAVDIALTAQLRSTFPTQVVTMPAIPVAVEIDDAAPAIAQDPPSAIGHDANATRPSPPIKRVER